MKSKSYILNLLDYLQERPLIEEAIVAREGLVNRFEVKPKHVTKKATKQCVTQPPLVTLYLKRKKPRDKLREGYFLGGCKCFTLKYKAILVSPVATKR